MIETDKNLKKAGLDVKIVLQIHDEIILEADESSKDEAIKILRESMENAADLEVPLIVDIDTGVSMYESK